jgi:inorganic triphosphatase YgiF
MEQPVNASPANRGADETEIRLAVTAAAAARLWKSDAIASVIVSPLRTRDLVSIYWDTPDFRLRDRGFALRARRTDGNGWVQTLKAPARRVDTRHEYEAALPGMKPDLALARSVGWRDDGGLIAVERELLPLFRTRIVRSSRNVRFQDGTLAELALDRGDIAIESAPRAAREPVLEVEIELATGSACRIYELAYRLVAELRSTRLLFSSKSERGYRMLTGAMQPARHAHDIGVSRKATAHFVGARALAESLAQVQGNVEPARLAEDREGVHQMRVAVRRLRVAAEIARQAGLPSISDKLVEELRWLWSRLGQSRDLDVFESETWPQVKQAAGDAAAPTAIFDANLAKLRASAYRRLRRVLDGRRFQRIMLSLAWIAAVQNESVTAATRTRRARHLATRMLSRRAKRIESVAIDRLPELRRHRVRIDAKKLRYLAEFFAGLYPARDARRYLRRLAAVQSALGALNDLVAMERTIDAAAASLTERERSAIVRMSGHYVTLRKATLSTELAAVSRKFAKTAVFWK